jgi:predicted nucleotidyltransferase
MREIDDKQRLVLADINNISELLGLAILLVGAGARIFVFDRQYNVEGRATKDLDFAVQVNDWSDFQSLSAQMTQGNNAAFKKTRVEHKFVHISTGIEIDIVPFGLIGQPNQILEWGDGNQMSLLGLNEAFSTAKILDIGGIEVKVVNPYALLVLKLIAWNDRQEIKDLEDIDFILRNYSDDNRILKELLNEIAQAIVEYEDGAIFLLAQDIRKNFSEDTVCELQKILLRIQQNQDRLFSRLIPRMIDDEAWDAQFDTTVHRFQVFQKAVEYNL